MIIPFIPSAAKPSPFIPSVAKRSRGTALVVLALSAFAACKKEEPQSPPPSTPMAKAEPVQQPPAPPPSLPATPTPTTTQPFMTAAMAGKPLWATIKTSQGPVVVELYSKDAPKTVANFVGLASGEKQWQDLRSGATQTGPLYKGTTFHRVIPGFMIQGGDPLGTGTGSPGFRFEDEFGGPYNFDEPGVLAMANSGPNTNGCQFFITVGPTPHLKGRHTIFGKVVAGYDVVQKIANAPRDARDRPLEVMKIEDIVVAEQNPVANR